ncbi:MAG: hypothetical protein JWR78_3218, partial [Mycobacterium sp.]|nr:hypothetical protein [Mycobacterium sp.]
MGARTLGDAAGIRRGSGAGDVVGCGCSRGSADGTTGIGATVVAGSNDGTGEGDPTIELARGAGTGFVVVVRPVGVPTASAGRGH